MLYKYDGKSLLSAIALAKDDLNLYKRGMLNTVVFVLDILHREITLLSLEKVDNIYLILPFYVIKIENTGIVNTNKSFVVEMNTLENEFRTWKFKKTHVHVTCLDFFFSCFFSKNFLIVILIFKIIFL